MISKKFRFHGHVAIKRVYRQGRVARNKLGTLHIASVEGAKNSKVAVVVSKKVNKSAVSRNRIRRRIFEIVRTNNNYANSQMSIVFTIYLADAEKMSHEELKKLTEDLLKNAN